MSTSLPILDADELHDFFINLGDQLGKPIPPSVSTPTIEAGCPKRPVKPLNGKQMIDKDATPSR
ncbi:hypothetical protein CAEBREN_18585 [Caenorhabditis brenneri]|uniref:Uncharacterized protein n=1 Tax=Caenorhabditis brenneri TaxID=135651 RepID=G0NVM0_CAEBE|nr:hypothetical protein CAEBREN_18585 [Caenorhabditis brenneri]